MSAPAHKPIVSPAPSTGVAVAVCVALVVVWGYLRLVLFNSLVFPITYVLPLFVCIWTRDRRLLWGMAGAFLVMAILKLYVVVPDDALDLAERNANLFATLLNICVGAAAVHLILGYRDRLDGKLRDLHVAHEKIRTQNEELQSQSEELAQQNEELAQQTEELEHSNEELQSQRQELEAQNEELQSQSEDIQALNQELASREKLLHGLLESVRLFSAEGEVKTDVCKAALAMLAGANGAVILERHGEELHLSAHAGEVEPKDTRDGFAELVWEQKKTAALNDRSKRPDLPLLSSSGPEFQSALASPILIRGEPAAVLAVYAQKQQTWSSDHFRLIEWLAAHSAVILETLRLQAGLRASEEQFRIMADTIPQLAWMADADGTHLWCNRRWHEYTGISRTENCNWCAPQVHQEDMLPIVVEQWERAVRTGEPFDMELPLRGLDGEYRWFLTRALPLKDGSGKVTKWFGTHTDISDKREAERRLLQAKDAAESASEAKDTFLAALSHELRTPLSPALMLASELCQSEGLPEDLRADCNIIRQHIELEVHLIDDLLDITRIENGRIQLDPKPVDVHEALRRAIEIVHPELEAKQIVFSDRLGASDSYVSGDLVRLQQIFWNVIRNAIKFTAQGGAIGVRTLNATGPNGRVLRVEVQDTGIGIDPGDTQRIFNSFEQGNEGRKFGGLGIGLALSRALIELHHGRIWAESDGVGKGATVCLEMQVISEKESPAPRETRGTAVRNGNYPSNLHVLLVEDHEDTRRTLGRLLERRGHKVSHAGSVAEGERLASENHFDLVISDVGLPDGTGHSLIRRIRLERPVLAIALSGFGSDADVRASLAAGFAVHLVKPISIEALDEAIRSVKAAN